MEEVERWSEAFNQVIRRHGHGHMHNGWHDHDSHGSHNRLHNHDHHHHDHSGHGDYSGHGHEYANYDKRWPSSHVHHGEGSKHRHNYEHGQHNEENSRRQGYHNHGNGQEYYYIHGNYARKKRQNIPYSHSHGSGETQLNRAAGDGGWHGKRDMNNDDQVVLFHGLSPTTHFPHTTEAVKCENKEEKIRRIESKASDEDHVKVFRREDILFLGTFRTPLHLSLLGCELPFGFTENNMSENAILLEWPELKRVIAENRCEFSLNSLPSGVRNPDINNEQLQNMIFASNTPLNYVELTRLELSVLHASVGKASRLKKLILHSNALEYIPEEIGDLKELQFLDLSTNKLESLPESIGSLPHLSTLLLAHNKISLLPDMSGMVSLQHLDVSHNQLTEFPTSFPNHSKLQTLALNSNRIKTLPSELDSLNDNLKIVNLSDNEIVDLPVIFCNSNKIKTLELANNRFSDNRFKKLTEDPRHKTSALVEYLKRKTSKTSKKDKNGKESEVNPDKGDVGRNEYVSFGPVITVNYGMNSILIERSKEALEIRPYIICCVLKDCLLNAEKIKQLLNIQITPIHRRNKISGRELVSDLVNEAEMVRKNEKRNVVSNIHKYIYLIQKLPLYPCLMDSNGLIVSLPPITNCEETKLDEDTRDILVEVTSTVTESTCIKVMDTFINEIITRGCLTNLVIEQVKVTQHTGELLAAYPGKNDLRLLKCTVRRELIVDSSNACKMSKIEI
uniref:B3/B4 tRNA-binding domain-containing protein n=1 Tax=Setaria digitata TaxID=48799 RepID=A0A915PIL4_9BILA